MVTMSTLVGTEGRGGADGREHPPHSVNTVHASACAALFRHNWRLIKGFYCLCRRESGIVARTNREHERRKVAGTFAEKVAGHLFLRERCACRTKLGQFFQRNDVAWAKGGWHLSTLFQHGRSGGST